MRRSWYFFLYFCVWGLGISTSREGAFLFNQEKKRGFYFTAVRKLEKSRPAAENTKPQTHITTGASSRPKTAGHQPPQQGRKRQCGRRGGCRHNHRTPVTTEERRGAAEVASRVVGNVAERARAGDHWLRGDARRGGRRWGTWRSRVPSQASTVRARRRRRGAAWRGLLRGGARSPCRVHKLRSASTSAH